MQGTSRNLWHYNRIRVLYVDDESALLKIVKTFLELSGQILVDTSISVSDAREKLETQPYDAILSDYDMPEMDGIEFLRYIRLRFGELPFILFTGKGREEVVINALNSGADFYLQKGGEPKSQFVELEHKIRQAVEQNRIKDELLRSEQRYRNVVEDQTEFICRFLPDGTHIFVNEAYCRYFGKDRDEIIGRKFCPEIPSEDLAAVREHFASLTPDHPVAIIEHRTVQPGGGIRWQRWSDRAIFDEQGRVTEYQSVGRDVTDRKQIEEELIRRNTELQASLEQLTATEEELRNNYDNLVTLEKELRESREQYRSVVEDQTEFICRFRPDGTHIFVNEAYCRYFGKNRDEIIGHKFKPEIPFEDRAAIREHFASLTRNSPTAILAHRIIMQDGEIRWQRWSDRAIFDKQGRVTEYQSVGRDITDQKKSEELLRESEARYRSLFERVPVGLYRTTPAGEILDANPAFVSIMGYPDLKSLKATRVQDLYADPDDRQKWQAIIERDGKVSDFEIRFRKYEGSIIWIRDSCAVVRDETGQVSTYKGSFEDITQRRHAEAELVQRSEDLHAAYEELTTTEEELRQNYEELARAEQDLRESEARYRAIFENTGTATVLIEEDTTICLANTEFEVLSGYPRKEIEGIKRWTEFVVPEDLERMIDQHRLRRVTPRSGLRHYEFRFLPKSGDIRTILLTIDLIPNSKRSVASLTDITGKKQTEEELKKAVKNLNLLSGITRHDILNQITIIQGYLELAKTRSGNPEKMADMLKKLESVTGMIRSQIEFTSVYQDLGISEPRWQEIHTALPLELIPDRVTPDIHLPEIEIYADPMLKKVFVNLLDNSLRHGGNVTTLTVSSEVLPDGLRITWIDNGSGIPPEEKEKIFEPGYGRHTGFGLFFVREVLTITGITIRETGTPGEGARFEIWVPAGKYRCRELGNN